MVGFIGNITQIVQVVAAAAQPYLMDLVAVFVFGLAGFIIAEVVLGYLHNKHVQSLGKQMADTTTLAVNALQNMLTMYLVGTQAEKVVDSKKEQAKQ